MTARTIRQWPILLVGLIFITAFALVGANFWRRGSLLIGIGVGVAAALLLDRRLQPTGRDLVRVQVDVAGGVDRDDQILVVVVLLVVMAGGRKLDAAPRICCKAGGIQISYAEAECGRAAWDSGISADRCVVGERRDRGHARRGRIRP